MDRLNEEASVLKGLLLVADLYDCAVCPADRNRLRALSLQAVHQTGLRPIDSAGVELPKAVWKEEYGTSELTLMVPLMESHLAIHTWPALKYVAVDLFTCGAETGAEEAVRALMDIFRPTTYEMHRIERGGRIGHGDANDAS